MRCGYYFRGCIGVDCTRKQIGEPAIWAANTVCVCLTSKGRKHRDAVRAEPRTDPRNSGPWKSTRTAVAFPSRRRRVSISFARDEPNWHFAPSDSVPGREVVFLERAVSHVSRERSLVRLRNKPRGSTVETEVAAVSCPLTLVGPACEIALDSRAYLA